MDKTLRRILLGLICACTFVSCEKIFDYNAVVEDKTDSVYPVDRMITDHQGRNIDVSITGRGLTHVNFRKKSTNQDFQLALKKLSDRDQAFIHKLPITETIVPKAVIETPRYVKIREKELAELMDQKKQLMEDSEKYGGKDTMIQKRSVQRDLRLLEPKIHRVDKQISDYWKQNPPK